METSNEISSSIAIDRDLRFRIKSTLALLNTFHNRNGAVHSRCFGPSLANGFNRQYKRCLRKHFVRKKTRKKNPKTASGRRLSLPGYPSGRYSRNAPTLCTSPDNSRYARKTFPSIVPVVVPFAARNRSGNSDGVVPSPVPIVPALPGYSCGSGGP